MVDNGYIQVITETAATFDQYGNPVAATKTPSSMVPCNVRRVKHQYIQYPDGELKLASYSIIIDMFKLKNITYLDKKEVWVFDNNQTLLGKYQIQNLETLTISRQIKIVV